jgi:hypothetical protein
MAITGDLPNDLGQLRETAARVRSAVDGLLVAARDPDSALTVSAGVEMVRREVDEWASVTADLERRLESHALEHTGDRFEVQARLGGVAMLHLSIAEDVAILAPFDGLPDGSLVAALEVTLPERADISLTVLADGGLLDSLSEPVEEGLPEDAASDGSHEIVGDDVDDVVKDIVDRAGTACISVAQGLTGILVQVAHPLNDALNLAPEVVADSIRRGIRKIAGIVKVLIGRAKKIFDSILGNYREVLSPVAGEIESALTESLGARLIAKLVDADTVRSNAKTQLSGARDDRERDRRIRKVNHVKTLNARWVGPVRFVAHGLPLLAPIMIGPVPTVAIAGAGLLGWTVLVTGDQLDTTRRFFPDLCPGVVRRAGGE